MEVPENSISISSSSVFLTFQLFLGIFQIVKNKILMRALASGLLSSLWQLLHSAIKPIKLQAEK